MVNSKNTRNRIGLTNLQMRTVTILTLGPFLFYLAMYSKLSACFIVFSGIFIGGIEWCGVKRHLKVALLMVSDESSESTNTHSNNSNSAASAHLQSLQNSFHKKHMNANSHEYALPVTPLSLYAVLKHLGWATLAFAAYKSEAAFLITFAHFFLIFVSVTLIAHNRLEVKVGEAVDRLAQYINSVDGADKANEDAATAERRQFLSHELVMIAGKQPTEQFLDFCLDIFGIFWLSGLVYPLFYYNVPRVGLPWGAATLLGNFMNDICALIVGRGLKACQARLARVFDVTEATTGNAAHDADAADASTSNGEKKKKRPLSEANALQRYLLRGTSPLYPAISPNKSTEGAIAGITANAITFALSMHITYTYVVALPDEHIIAARLHCMPVWLLVGTAMGGLGVIGDLLQSLLKRAARVKDAGFIVPGHGGVLDRLDGLLLAFPFMFCAMSVLSALSQ